MDTGEVSEEMTRSENMDVVRGDSKALGTPGALWLEAGLVQVATLLPPGLSRGLVGQYTVVINVSRS